MIRLSHLFKRAGTDEAPDMTPPAPERLTFAVGDLHGHTELFERMLQAIEVEAGGAAHDIVFLGDYVDRGPDGAGLLRTLMALESGAEHVTCLLGNHDRMLLDFLDDPKEGEMWLLNGGDTTLESFGLTDIPGPEIADMLHAAMGAPLVEWLRARPLWWRSGTLIAVHARTDTRLGMDDQPETTLLWARPPRRPKPRKDGTWVVHGHTIVPSPELRAGHVAVDTGAFATGVLSAGVFAPGAPPRFLQVREDA